MRKHIATMGVVTALAFLGAACGTSPRTSASSATPTPSSAAPSPAVVADLAPTGSLRLAVPAMPPFLAHGSPPTGFAVTEATGLAARLGVPLAVTVYPDGPAVLAAMRSTGWDIAVLPITPATSSAVDFSGPLFTVGHTLLVRSGAPISSLAQADQPGVRIASVATSPHTAALASRLPHATIVRVEDDAHGLALLKSGEVDAFADGRGAMAVEQSQVPGSTVLAEDFFTPQFGIAVAKGHPSGLAWLTALVEQLKSSGAVQQAIDSAHLTGVKVVASTSPSGAASAQ